MKINDRGRLVWDEEEYRRGMIDAPELDEGSDDPGRERPRNVLDEARQEMLREAEISRRDWDEEQNARHPRRDT